jgi:glycosyltransferase involved in cell wall biosynthesis
MKVAIIGNYTRNLVVFRKGLILEGIARGWTMVCVGPESDESVRQTLEGLGVRLCVIPMSRSSVNPLSDLAYYFRLRKWLAAERPDCVVAFTHKPNIYVSLAARKLNAAVVLLVEGLGYAFIDGQGVRRLIARRYVLMMYRLAARRADAILFLNRDDGAVFAQRGILLPDEKRHIIPGIGVDLCRFSYVAPPEGAVRFLLVARLLKTKGVGEYLEVARRMRAKHRDVSFALVGDVDPGADGVERSSVQAAIDDAVIDYKPFTERVEECYRSCSVYVLPSYREGMPVTIMEAMATGRPIITTTAPGCREMIEGNGVAVEPGNADALEAACEFFVWNRSEIRSMGIRSRELAVRRFDSRAASAVQADIIGNAMRPRGTACGGPAGAAAGFGSRSAPRRVSESRVVVFVVSEDWYLVSHRLALIVECVRMGLSPVVVTNVNRHRDTIERAGALVVHQRLTRAGMNPIHEVAYACKLFKIYLKFKPVMVHHVALKPAIYGTIAARLARVPAIVNELAGRGFMAELARRAGPIGEWALFPLYWLIGASLSTRHSALIVQNNADFEFATGKMLIDHERVSLVPGVGADPDKFKPRLERRAERRPVVVAFVSRMLWAKGVKELISAARELKTRGSNVEFVFVGAPDSGNPDAVPTALLEKWHCEGLITYRGFQSDVAAFWRDADIAVLPTFYAEGVPKALLEAAMTGLPIITTDTPGCNYVVEDGRNGLLIPKQNAFALASAIERLAGSADLRESMGSEGRAMAIQRFTTSEMVGRINAIYRAVLGVNSAHIQPENTIQLPPPPNAP